MFASTFALGLAIFLVFGYLAGVFSGNKGVIDALTGSPIGFIALFGATLIASSPFIGLTIWALDRAIKTTIEENKK